MTIETAKPSESKTPAEILSEAARLVEREGHYRFMKAQVPAACEDVGCVLGWCAFVAGEKTIDEAAVRLGFKSADPEMEFYDKMEAITKERGHGPGRWHDDASVAAESMRELANRLVAE